MTFLGVVFAGIALLGCGSGGSTTAAERPPAPAQIHSAAPNVKQLPAAANEKHVPGDFRVKGGDNSIQRFGSEAGNAEISEATTALNGYLAARAARDWARACSYLSVGTRRQLAQLAGSPGGSRTGCPTTLAAFSASLPDRALRKAAIAHVGALRSAGRRGFLLFQGAQGAAFFIQVALEAGRWRIAAIAPSPLS